MPRLLETLWNEPRAPDPPTRVWRDWALLAVVVPVAIAEGVLSETVVWRPLAIALTLSFAVLLFWRRTQPLRIVLLVHGASIIVHLFAAQRGVDWTGLSSSAIVLILPYALLRWGSGREVVPGLLVTAASFAVSMVGEVSNWTEIVGASLFMLFPAALGASVRYRDSAERRATEQARLREREQLARELHDTVAHHVSAIAVQAQAARALADSRPEAAVEVLGVIEESASRTLTEMRRIVGALRGPGAAARSPTAKLEDIRRLARDAAAPVPVDVTFAGALDNLDTTLESTLYRIAQEAVTNAVRHARGANQVTVHVEGDAEQVHLRVADDGTAVATGHRPGFGLRGMAERVALLNGTLRTGPGSDCGWIVDAVLPKQGAGS
ncbi:MAG: sensor histidine kinase [Pseudomonadota bacterium]